MILIEKQQQQQRVIATNSMWQSDMDIWSPSSSAVPLSSSVWGSVSLSLFPDSPPSSVRVGSDHVDVFDGNFFSVMNEVRANIDAGFCYVALDTEYPGCVVNTQDFSPHDFAAVAQSVNQTNLIQLGLTLYNHLGQRPKQRSTFVFHIKWVEAKERSNAESIALLKRSGLDFARNAFEGISLEALAIQFASLTCNPNICFIAFHGLYDFAYLIKILTRAGLTSKFHFIHDLNLLFPRIVDLKALAHRVNRFNGGLDGLAKQNSVARVGTAHNSGSDARLTGDLFFKMLAISTDWQRAFANIGCNQIFGL